MRSIKIGRGHALGALALVLAACGVEFELELHSSGSDAARNSWAARHGRLQEPDHASR